MLKAIGQSLSPAFSALRTDRTHAPRQATVPSFPGLRFGGADGATMDHTPVSLLDSALTAAQLQAQLQVRLPLAKADTAEKNRLAAELAEVLDAFIQGRWTEDTQPGKQRVAQTALRDLLGPRGQGNLVAAQMNPRPSDVEGNARQVMKYLASAEAVGADLVVFPELTLMGYPVLDTIMRDPTAADNATTDNLNPAESLVMQNVQWLQTLASQTRPGGTWAMVGFVEPRLPESGEKRYGKPFFNSMAILGDGQIKGVVRKVLLPTYKEFDDDRTFESSPASGVHHPQTLMDAQWGFRQDSNGHRAQVPNGRPITVHGHNYGVVLCEDGWSDPDYFTHPPYDRDPVTEVAQVRPDVLLNLSASPTGEGKEQLKHNMLSATARKHKLPLVYANQTGGIDELVFDGASRAYDAQGQLIARARMFREQFQVVNPLQKTGKIHSLPGRLEETLTRSTDRLPDLYDTAEMGRMYEAAVLGIRDYFKKIGYTQKALLGLSGGLDSAVCAVLLADALGPENVLAVSLPTRITPGDNKTDARVLADNLGIQLIEIPIAESVDNLNRAIDNSHGSIGGNWQLPGGYSAAKDNAQARMRATILWQLGNDYKAFPIATSDLSELAMGYTTINGDMTGMLSPISDMLKTQVKTLAAWMNRHRAEYGHTADAIPTRIIEKPPGADLRVDPATGQLITAEQDLMPYAVFDDIFRHWTRRKMGREQLMGLESQYERDQGCRLPDDTKASLLDKAFFLMRNMVYKWKIAPPTLMVNGNGISPRMYRQPITSARLDTRGKTPEQMQQALRESVGDAAPASP